MKLPEFTGLKRKAFFRSPCRRFKFGVSKYYFNDFFIRGMINTKRILSVLAVDCVEVSASILSIVMI